MAKGLTHYEKTAESVQLLLAERGYVVVGLKPGRGEYKVGQILNQCCAQDFGQPWQVIAVTTHAEWVEQAMFIQEKLGFKMPQPDKIEIGEGYYRITTD